MLDGITKSVSSPVLVSESNPAISSRSIRLSSSVPKYLSLATRSSIRSMIFRVVSTPTSEVTSTSSKSSSTSSSTFDFPATALDSLLKKLDLDFSSPLFSVCFFSFELVHNLKIPSLALCDKT